jgi:heme/copper-type cytochrome/quinol oxidase subunit 3
MGQAQNFCHTSIVMNAALHPGEVNMRERFHLHKHSVPTCGISIFLLVATLLFGALFSALPGAHARELSHQDASPLGEWQRYAAWHPSWHYIAVQNEDCQ